MQIQLSNNQIDAILNLLTVIKDQNEQQFNKTVDQTAADIVNAKVEKLKAKLDRISKINAAFLVALSQHFDPEFSDFIVTKLDQGREANDWACMMQVYSKIKNLHDRQLVLGISALYRMQFKPGAHPALKSQLKYAMACDHCGSIAQKIIGYLKTQL